MKKSQAFILVFYSLLLFLVSCSFPPDREKTNELEKAIIQSWGKIESGKGSYRHRSSIVTNYLEVKDISEGKKKVDEYFSKVKFGTPSSWETNYPTYIFSKDKFRYESIRFFQNHKIHEIISYNGSEIKNLSISTTFQDSTQAYQDSSGHISKYLMGDPADCDPFFFPVKELLSSFLALKLKEISITPDNFYQNKKDTLNQPSYKKDHVKATYIIEDNFRHFITSNYYDHSISGPRKEIMDMVSEHKSVKITSIRKEKYEGKEYLAVTFTMTNRKETYYIDPDRDYRTFYIVEEYRGKNSKEKDITRIEYQTINGILFPKYIIRYLIQDKIVIHLRELIFSDDWQLNTTINDNDFEIVFPKGIRILNHPLKLSLKN